MTTSSSRSRLALYPVAILGALLVVAPFWIVLVTSLGTQQGAFNYPPKLFPVDPQWSNYWEVLVDREFGRYVLNSLVVAFIGTAISVTLDSLAGYAFARLRFRGSKALLGVVLATIMIPAQLSMIPLYAMVRSVPLAGGNSLTGQGGTGLLDSYPGLIVPGLASTFGVYLMYQFFSVLPRDLLEAARLDGLREFQIYRRIFLPLAMPALATVAIVNFTDAWNAFLWPLLVTNSPARYTVQLGLAQFKTQYSTEWHLLCAGVVIACIPVFVVFVIGQKYFVRGMATSGLKG